MPPPPTVAAAAQVQAVVAPTATDARRADREPAEATGTAVAVVGMETQAGMEIQAKMEAAEQVRALQPVAEVPVARIVMIMVVL